MVFKRIVGSALVLLCAGCVSYQGGESLGDLDIPLAELQKAVDASLPLGRRELSPNGREFFSNYFQFVSGRYLSADRVNERSYAHVYVLGDRRPYTIEVLVVRQRKSVGRGVGDSAGFVDVGRDRSLAKALKAKIKATLSERRGDRSFIDDFRAF